MKMNANRKLKIFRKVGRLCVAGRYERDARTSGVSIKNYTHKNKQKHANNIPNKHKMCQFYAHIKYL